MAWFKEWFNTPYYHILYKDRDFQEAEIFIAKLTEFLQLPKDSKVIDLACGKGRHSVYLNKLGYNVLGLDLSDESILHNKQFENETLKFAVHDMRDEIFPELISEKVDAVMNLFTSFGYFEEEKEDQQVFDSVKNSLKENGIFVLDFLNEKFVKNTLVPETVQQKSGIDFHIKKRIEDGHVIKDIIFEHDNQPHHYYEKVKLHTQEEILNLANSKGFTLKKVLGNYHLEDFEAESSPRCIFILEA